MDNSFQSFSIAGSASNIQAFQAKLILDTVTASQALGKLIRFDAQTREMWRFPLPALFPLRAVADVAQFKPTPISGSSRFLQVIDVKPGYTKGTFQLEFARAQDASALEVPKGGRDILGSAKQTAVAVRSRHLDCTVDADRLSF